jgi:S-formylglutathione hydrolase FrmB
MMMDKVSKYIGRVCCVGRWAAGLMKLTVDWAETKYLLKTRYPMGHSRVRKNTRPVPVLFRVG